MAAASDDGKLADWFERLIKNEKRPLMYETEKSMPALLRLSDWQLEVLAKNLDVIPALRCLEVEYDVLPKKERCEYILAELKSLSRPLTWTPLMATYIERTTRHDAH